MASEAKNNQGPRMAEQPVTAFQAYLYANLLFWAFLGVVAVLTLLACGGVMDDVVKAVFRYIFLILGGGFTLVSVLDYFYERYSAPEGSRP